VIPIVLAVLIVVAAIIAVDTVRQRRRLRRRDIDILPLLASRLASTAAPTVRVDPGAAIVAHATRTQTPPSTAVDVWNDLEEIVDPSTFRPMMASGSEWKLFRLRWGNDYAMVANPPRDVHFKLDPWEVELLPLMDGTRTVADIIVERMDDGAGLDAGAVVALVQSLHEGGFLDPRPVDVAAAVTDRLDPASPARRTLRMFAKTLRLEWTGADRFVKALYRGGLKYVFTPPVVVLSIAVGVGGFAAFLSVQRSGRFSLDQGSAALESVILITLSFVLTFAHELGHALVETREGRHIGSAGFFIFFGSPAFFVDASDGLMMDRGKRILQSAMGPGTEFVLAGVASLVVFFFPDWAGSGLLYRFALLNLFVIFLNLIPLLELDGYWIFSDLIQVPDLRPRSLAFVQHDMWHKLRIRERFSPQEWGLAVYGILGVAFTIFSFYTAYFFWKEIFGGLVFSLWDGGTASRVLLIALALILFGPLIRGLLSLARTTWRRMRAFYRSVRFKLETGWRVEAAELIDALPAFDDLPDEILSDLAGRVRLLAVRRGQPVFRQGDRAEAFYVVRRGQLDIETEHPETGDTQVLTILHRGDAFGELGLLQATPRSATARATTETELFVIDKGTFDRLLADAIEAPEFELTLQSMAELRELPAFANLRSDALGSLLEHGAWISAAPGEAFVEQGDEGDAFYAIRSGRADVVRDGEPIATIGSGDHFGETALLTDEPRNATVRAHTPVRAFRLDQEGFENVIADAFRRGTLRAASDRTWEH
jgi:CRP-like cAMP-binding protein/Zn-dependent protease